ncbi:MAG: Coenzyme F420 hydrogenase/dehydrogenase, beta subunit C-terminal domain [Pseudomonadota bacterium]
MKTDPLTSVMKGGLCTGCGACAAAVGPNKLSMRMVEPGYLRPAATAPLTEAEAERFEAICPGLGLELEAEGRDAHPLWGPYLRVRTGWAADPALRHKASSGGALSAVLAHMLESGAADVVIQTKATAAPAYANAPTVSRRAADVLAAAGSRYAPSAPLAALPEALATGKRFVFVGKPCDVAALRALGRYDPRIGAQVVLAVSFFCAGVPAHAGARAVIDALGVAEADLAAFRYRGEGWPGSAMATRHDGSSETMTYAESWGDILSKHVQPRCRICPDGVGGFADLVCADAWACDENGYPTFEERVGRSLVITRTDAGEAAARAAIDAGGLIVETGEDAVTDPAQIAAFQPGQRKRRGEIAARIAARAAMGRRWPRYRGFHLVQAAREAGLVANLRGFFGTARRILIGRA